MDAPLLGGLGVLHQKCDRDRRSAAGAENLTTFALRSFARCPLISTQVEHIDVGELLRQALAEAVRRSRVQPPSIGDISDDTGITDTIARPPDRPYVAIVKRVLIGRA